MSMAVASLRNRPDKPWRSGGFTFIELMVTLAILSILASLALPLAEHSIRREQELQLQRALLQIRQALDAYKQAFDNGEITTTDRSVSGYPPSLDTLVNGVPNKKEPGATLIFLRKIPRDPFAANPKLSAAQTWRKRSYASTAAAPQEGADVFDVFSSSTEVGLNGVPYAEW